MSRKTRIVAGGFTPLRDKVFVTDLDHGVRKTAGGLLLPDDNMTESGVRERWAKVYAVGSAVEDLAPGDWVLIAHGRWTERVQLELDGREPVWVWRIDYPDAVLIASDHDPRAARPASLAR